MLRVVISKKLCKLFIDRQEKGGQCERREGGGEERGTSQQRTVKKQRLNWEGFWRHKMILSDLPLLPTRPIPLVHSNPLCMVYVTSKHSIFLCPHPHAFLPLQRKDNQHQQQRQNKHPNIFASHTLRQGPPRVKQEQNKPLKKAKAKETAVPSLLVHVKVFLGH